MLCGPSGSGKSTVMKKLMAEFGEYFGFSVSHTTRQPRPGEVEGRDYHYVTRETMEHLVEQGQFIENAQFSGNMYGTSKTAVQDVLAGGKICILDIDVQGVKAVKETDLSPLYVFIKPPSLEELEQRLRDRGTETEESLSKGGSIRVASETVWSLDHKRGKHEKLNEIRNFFWFFIVAF